MPVLLFILSLAVYMFTLAPTISPGDSGELVGAAYVLGIAHPPGYPLYCILSKLATFFIPFGNIAYRTNLFSAILSASAVTCLYKIINGLGVSAIFAFCGAMCFVFSKTLWSQSVISEVYALNIFLIGFIIFQLVKLIQTQKTILSYQLFLVSGLGISNHHTTLIVLAVLLIVCLIYFKLKASSLFFWFTLLVLGLSLYLYLPLRTLTNPTVNWGNPHNFHDILNHIIRKQYGAISSSAYLAAILQHIAVYGKRILEEWTITPFFIGLIGIIYSFVKDRKIALIIFGMFLVLSIGFILLLDGKLTPESYSILSVFFIPSYFIFAVWIAFGLQLLLTRFHNLIKIFGSLVLIILIFSANLNASNQSSNFLSYNLGHDIISTVNGPLLLSGDNQLFSIVYLRTIEGKGMTADFYEESGMLFPTLDKEQLNKISNENPNIFYAMWSGWERKLTSPKTAWGIVYKASFDANEINDLQLWRTYRMKGLADINAKTAIESRTIAVQYYYLLGERYSRLGNFELAQNNFERASELGYDLEKLHYNLGCFYEKINWTDLAIMEFKEAIEIDPTYSFAHNNLGVIYFKTGRTDDAILEFEKAIEKNANNIEAYNNLGSALAKKGDIKKAIAIWEKGLIILPSNTLILENIKKAKDLMNK